MNSKNSRLREVQGKSSKICKIPGNTTWQSGSENLNFNPASLVARIFNNKAGLKKKF